MDYSKYKAIPFWSWNDKLEIKELEEQIEWMKENSFGGYFMHARMGLKTEYLGKDWFDCIRACCEKGEQIGMDTWAYDENGWPSGFVGGKLLEEEENRDRYLTYSVGEYDEKALVSYLITESKLIRVKSGGASAGYLNVFLHVSTSTVDILNEKVVDKFIDQTHERYKKEVGKDFSKKIKGFFTDEPQYYRWQQPYTTAMPEYFKKTYNEDVLDGLGLLFIEKEGFRAFRYKYWLAMQTLMLKAFAEKIYGWCVDNGVEFTGHYLEETHLNGQMACCAGIMPFYMYETMPGIDKLGRHSGTPVAPKQVSSVARQTGKKRVLIESFGVAGWDTTPLELKTIGETALVNGVNVICQHLVPYSEHGERKRDHPVHFSWVNPWVKHDYKTFNEYFAKLGCLLGESEEVVNVGLFSPIRSVYLDYERFNTKHDVNASYWQAIWKLSRANVPYHMIDETVVERVGRVEGKKFIVGDCAYDYLVFPKTKTMGKTMQQYLQKFYDNGGKILFLDEEPTYLEGEPFEFGFTSNCTYEEVENAQPYAISQRDTDVLSTYRVIDGKKYIYAVNVSATKSYEVEYSGQFNSFNCYDIETGKMSKKSKKIHFEPGESFVLFFSDEKVDFTPYPDTFTLSGPYQIKSATDNYLTLDNLRYSFDGKNYSDKVRYMGAFKELLKQKYEGDLYLKYEFEVEKIPARIDLLAEDMNTLSTFVNGTEVNYTGTSDFEKQLYRANIAPLVKVGNNEVIIKIHFYESDFIYYAISGKVTESLKNIMSYDTTIEACYLQGDFGVYEKNGLVNGKNPNVLLGENFYISTRKTVTNGEIVKDGYPFFMGKIVLGCKYNAKGDEKLLKLVGRHHLSEVRVNGEKVEKSYFSDTVDVSKHIKKGENDIEVTLILAPRNLLGPHHILYDEEPLGVSPQSFELGGTWVNGKSTHERDSYSFINLGLTSGYKTEVKTI